MLGVWIDPVTAHEIMTLPVFFAMTASVFSFAGNLQARTRRRHRRDRIGARIDQDDLPIESPGGTPPILSMTRAAAAAKVRPPLVFSNLSGVPDETRAAMGLSAISSEPRRRASIIHREWGFAARSAAAIFFRQFDVVRGALAHLVIIAVLEFAHEFGGTAGPELALGDALPRRHQGTGRDHRALLHHDAVHHGRRHADEAVVFERAGVDQRHVTDGDVLADDDAFVHHRIILHIRVAADADAAAVAAQHHAVPDAGILADLDVADQRRVLCDPRRRMDLRREIAIGAENAHGNNGSCGSPVASSRPSMTYMSSIAWPDAPFTRLSSAEMMIARPDSRSCASPMRQRFDPRTWCVAGIAPSGRTWTNFSSS